MLGGRIAPVNIADLPFNRLIGIAPSQKEGCVLSLPNDVRYTNHLGTVHACALIALAEATSGDYLIKESAGVEFEVIAVVRRLEAKFRKPACGAVHSTITVTTEKKEEFLSLLGNSGGGRAAALSIPRPPSPRRRRRNFCPSWGKKAAHCSSIKWMFTTRRDRKRPVRGTAGVRVARRGWC